MAATAWYLTVGGLLLVMAALGSRLRHLPFTGSILYLMAGIVLGPMAVRAIAPRPVEDAAVLEILTEIAVIVSLFTVGLKLRTPIRFGRGWRGRGWGPAVRLALLAMVLTVGAIALAGTTLMGLPLGAAVLLGAVLAPTDPVLASDVQLESPGDTDPVRLALTGEAGLNDGTAFPFVMLGLGLLGLHELGPLGVRWLSVDVLWAVGAGLGIGALAGLGVARAVLWLRRERREGVGLDDFLALGLIAVAYGGALAVHAYGFLAVFAAGLALRRVEREESGEERPPDDVRAAAERGGEGERGADAAAVDRDLAPAYMAQAVLEFNTHLERLGEFAVLLIVGASLAAVPLAGEGGESWWFVPLLLVVIRPVCALVSLVGSELTGVQRVLIAWFGVRGIGSLYYLTFALHFGVAEHPEAERLAGVTLAVVAASIVVHGVSATPLMRWYNRRCRRVAGAGGGGDGGCVAAGPRGGGGESV